MTEQKRADVEATGVSELALEVADLDAAEQFYAGVLGLPVVERWDTAVWLLIGDRTRLGLWLSNVPPLAGERGGAHVHFALHVSETSLDLAVGRLRDQGHDVHEEVFRNGRGRAAYVKDPDGHVLELWTWDVSSYLDARLSDTSG